MERDPALRAYLQANLTVQALVAGRNCFDECEG
jgi:hypothetical protein